MDYAGPWVTGGRSRCRRDRNRGHHGEHGERSDLRGMARTSKDEEAHQRVHTAGNLEPDHAGKARDALLVQPDRHLLAGCLEKRHRGCHVTRFRPRAGGHRNTIDQCEVVARTYARLPGGPCRIDASHEGGIVREFDPDTSSDSAYPADRGYYQSEHIGSGEQQPECNEGPSSAHGNLRVPSSGYDPGTAV